MSFLLTARVFYLIHTNILHFLQFYTELSKSARILNYFFQNLNIFLKNGDPVSFTDFCIKKYLDNLFVKKEVFLITVFIQLTCVLSFFSKKSLQLISRLLSSDNKTIRFHNFKVVFQYQCKLNTLFWFKEALNKKIHSFLVYRDPW